MKTRMGHKRARVEWDTKENRVLPNLSTSFRLLGLKEDAKTGVFVSSKELQLLSLQGLQSSQKAPLDTQTQSIMIKKDNMVFSKKSQSLIDNYLVTWQQGYISNIHQRFIRILHLETQRTQDVSVLCGNIHPQGFEQGFVDSNGESLVLLDEDKSRLWCWRDINGECFGGASSTTDTDIGRWSILPLSTQLFPETAFFEGKFFFSSMLGSIFAFCTASITKEDTCQVGYWTFEAENEWKELSHQTWSLDLSDLETSGTSQLNPKVIIQSNLQHIVIVIGRNVFVLASTSPYSIKNFESNQEITDAIFIASDSTDSETSLALLQGDGMLQVLSGINGEGSDNTSLQDVDLELVDINRKTSTHHVLMDLNDTMSSSSTRAKAQQLYWSSTIKRVLVLTKERTGNGSSQMIVGQFQIEMIKKDLASFLDLRFRQLQAQQARTLRQRHSALVPTETTVGPVNLEEKFKAILADETVGNKEEKMNELLELARHIVTSDSQYDKDLLWTILLTCNQYFIMRNSCFNDVKTQKQLEKAHMDLLLTFILPLHAGKIHEWSQKAISAPRFTSQIQRKRYFQKQIQELMYLSMDPKTSKITRIFVDVFFSSSPQLLLKFCCQSSKSDDFPISRGFTQLLKEGKVQEALHHFQQFVQEEEDASENTYDQQLLRLLGAYVIMSEQLQIIPLVVPALQDATSSIAGIIHKKDFVQSSLCLVPVSSEVMERAVDNTLGTTALEVVVCLLLKKSRLQELFTIVDFCLQSNSDLKFDRLQQLCNIATESITSSSNTRKSNVKRSLVKQLFVYIIQRKLEELSEKLQNKSLVEQKPLNIEDSITRVLKDQEKKFLDRIDGDEKAHGAVEKGALKDAQELLWLIKEFLTHKNLKPTPSDTSHSGNIVRLLMDVLYTKEIKANEPTSKSSSSFCLFFHQLLTMSNAQKETKEKKQIDAYWGLADNEIDVSAVAVEKAKSVVDRSTLKMLRTFVLYVWTLWICEKSSIVLEYIRQNSRHLDPESNATRRLGRVCASLAMELHSYTLVVPSQKEESSLLQMELIEKATLWHPELTSRVVGSFFSVFPLHTRVYKRFSRLKRSIEMPVTGDTSALGELQRKSEQLVDEMVEKCILSSSNDGSQLVRGDDNEEDDQLGIYLSTCCSNYRFRKLCFQLFITKGEYSLRIAPQAKLRRKNSFDYVLSDQVGRKEIQKLLQQQQNKLDKKILDLQLDLQHQKIFQQQHQQQSSVEVPTIVTSSKDPNSEEKVMDVAELAKRMYEEDSKVEVSSEEIPSNNNKRLERKVSASKSARNVLRLFQLSKKESNHEKNLEFFKSFEEKQVAQKPAVNTDQPNSVLSDPFVDTQDKDMVKANDSNAKALLTPLRYSEADNFDLTSANLKLLIRRSRVRNQAISLIDKDFTVPPAQEQKESTNNSRKLNELPQETVSSLADATTQACILKNTSAQTDAVQLDQAEATTESLGNVSVQNIEAPQVIAPTSIPMQQTIIERTKQQQMRSQAENEPKEPTCSGVQCSLEADDHAERQIRRVQLRLSPVIDLSSTSINRFPRTSSKNYLKVVSVPFDNGQKLEEDEANEGAVRPIPRPRLSLKVDTPLPSEQPLKDDLAPTIQPEVVFVQEQWQVYGDTTVSANLPAPETVELKGDFKRLEETLTNQPVIDTTSLDLCRFGLDQEGSAPEGTRIHSILDDMKEMKKRLKILEKCADEIDQDFDESHRKIQQAEAQHRELVRHSRSKRIMKTLDFLQEQVEEDLARSSHRMVADDQEDPASTDSSTVTGGVLSRKASKDAMKARKLVEQIEALVRK